MKRIFERIFYQIPLNIFHKYLVFLSSVIKPDESISGRRIYHLLGNLLPLPITVDGINFDATTKTSMVRALRLKTKEPDTINWLDDYLEAGDTFYDVGANIGVYSLYAAQKGNSVVAIEPESSSYAVLNRNIHLNGYSKTIYALNLAVYNQEVLSKLNIGNYQPGKSGHSFHDKLDSSLHLPTRKHEQAVIGMPLDTLVNRYAMDFPNVIKIDVDGNESKIIEGMKTILKDRRLKSIAIEIDKSIDSHKEISKTLAAVGFKLLSNPRYRNYEYEKTGVINCFYARSV